MKYIQSEGNSIKIITDILGIIKVKADGACSDNASAMLGKNESFATHSMEDYPNVLVMNGLYLSFGTFSGQCCQRRAPK